MCKCPTSPCKLITPGRSPALPHTRCSERGLGNVTLVHLKFSIAWSKGWARLRPQSATGLSPGLSRSPPLWGKDMGLLPLALTFQDLPTLREELRLHSRPGPCSQPHQAPLRMRHGAGFPASVFSVLAAGPHMVSTSRTGEAWPSTKAIAHGDMWQTCSTR